MKICVFCASSESVDNVYFKAAADLGKEIVTRGGGCCMAEQIAG